MTIEEALKKVRERWGELAHISMYAKNQINYSVWVDENCNYEDEHPKSNRVGHGGSLEEALISADCKL